MTVNRTDYNEIAEWDSDLLDELAQKDKPLDYGGLVVYSRDWTIETIVNQINKGNIDLYARFQRRHAWKDDKKSRLIESLIIGIPVPEIVIAENPKKKKSFIVIDGKQRLLTIAGFINPDKYQYWKTPKVKKLATRPDLNGLTFEQIKGDPQYEGVLREFFNADLRCTILGNYGSYDILYDIFYRLNTGSEPLTSQELRQVLNKGEFADYLMKITSDPQPIQEVLKLSEPDPRLRDVEMILRFMAFVLFSESYRGNLRKFLDDQMGAITENWETYAQQIRSLYDDLNSSIFKLQKVMESTKIGRKFTKDKWEGRINKALFEVETYYFMHLTDDIIDKKSAYFLEQFKIFCGENADFRKSIEIATNNLDSYAIRHKLFNGFINSVFETDIPMLPFNYTFSE